MEDDLVASFCGITGATESQALQTLEATGYNLQEAIELFFAAGGDLGSGPPAAAPPAAANFMEEPEDDEALARRLQKYVIYKISLLHLNSLSSLFLINQSINSPPPPFSSGRLFLTIPVYYYFLQ
jgi:hypothetical protein